MTTKSTVDLPEMESASPQKVPHRWRNLSVMGGSSIVDNTEAGLVNMVFPSLAASLRLDSSHLGIIAALGKVASVPAGPFWVWLSTKVGRRWVLALTSFASGAFGLGAAFSESFPMLLVFTTLMAMSAIGGMPISMAVISDSFVDRERARAMGIFFGALQLISLAIAPLIAAFLGMVDGWRWAFGAMGVACFVIGVVVLSLFRDPGVGAADRLEGAPAASDTRGKVTVRQVMGLFRIPSYNVMMVSRLLSGHLLILIFGVQFLVTERGIDNAFAVIVALPFGVGYAISTVSIGYALPALDRLMGERSRVVVLQAAQVLFAVTAFFATQIVYDDFAAYAVLWGVLGIAQGLNPPVNRPIVAAVVMPELRGQAFAIWLTVFETIGWAIFALSAGSLAVQFGLQQVFLWVLVGLMLVNAAFLSILYRTYPRDTAVVRAALQARTSDELV
ncbi:MFS transporter [Microbacterium hominis]|uniref:MFS transporter n=1 Tax=Microbacterium hominis TaxID=162426 RepID=A0A7D4UCE1_9MICO|nr:MFS transporter [Microbacterium hominis]QKJ20623.1 MFS transporter [Microbacterium hominis]